MQCFFTICSSNVATENASIELFVQQRSHLALRPNAILRRSPTQNCIGLSHLGAIAHGENREAAERRIRFAACPIVNPS